MEQKQNLNEALYNIISFYNASTSAAMIKNMVADMFDELREVYRNSEEIMWTDEHDKIWDNWTKENI